MAKFLFVVLITSLGGGCASAGPPLPPSLELPTPVSDLRALRKGDKVYLAWTVPTQTTDHGSVRIPGTTLICRSTLGTLTECGTGVGEAPAAIQKAASPSGPPVPTGSAMYVDSLSTRAAANPWDEVTYAVEVLNTNRRGAGLSNQVRVPSAPALPPPNGFRADLSAEGVRISWTCPPAPSKPLPGVLYRLRIYRRRVASQTDTKVAEPDLTDCQGPPVLDQSFEWGETYDYRAAAVLTAAQPGQPEIEIEGDDTPAVRVVANDVFPPAVPSGLQAVFSGVGQAPFVDLIWSPDSDADLAGYNVYRNEEHGEPSKLNSELIKTPAYRDGNVQSGKKYFYAVSAVDLRGNESEKSEEASEIVP